MIRKPSRLKIWRTVVSDLLHEGLVSILRDRAYDGFWWELGLDCGHTVNRRVRYKPRPVQSYNRLRRRSYDDVLPPPQRVLCEECRLLQSRTVPPHHKDG